MYRSVLIGVLSLMGPAAIGADIGLVDWGHVSYAYTDVNGIETWETDVLPGNLQSPSSGSTSAVIGGTSASAVYVFAYSPVGGTFDIDSAHMITSTGHDWETRSWVYGGLRLSPDVPVAVDLSGSIMATMSMDQSSASVSFSIVRSDDQAQLLWIGDGQQGFVGTHTWDVAGDFVLQPGATYTVEFWFSLDGSPYSPAGVVEDGTGHASITLAAVPEPNALYALMLGALACRRCARGTIMVASGESGPCSMGGGRTSASDSS